MKLRSIKSEELSAVNEARSSQDNTNLPKSMSSKRNHTILLEDRHHEV